MSSAMSQSLILPEHHTGPLLRRRFLAVAAVLLLAGTYTVLVLTHPAGLTDGLGQTVALATFAAYLAAALMLLAAVLPELPVATRI